MSVRAYFKLRAEINQTYLPQDFRIYFWAWELLKAIYGKAPIHIIERHIKDLAARVDYELLCGALGYAYLEALMYAMRLGDHKLAAYVEDKIKKLGIPYVVRHQPPVRKPFVMLFEQLEHEEFEESDDDGED